MPQKCRLNQNLKGDLQSFLKCLSVVILGQYSKNDIMAFSLGYVIIHLENSWIFLDIFSGEIGVKRNKTILNMKLVMFLRIAWNQKNLQKCLKLPKIFFFLSCIWQNMLCPHDLIPMLPLKVILLFL